MERPNFGRRRKADWPYYSGRSVCSSQLYVTQQNKNQANTAMSRSRGSMVCKRFFDKLFFENYSDYLQAVDMVARFVDNISTLAFCQPVSVSTESENTRGCAIVTVSDKCDAIVHLEGLIDVEKEKTRITGLVEKKRLQLVRLQESMVVPNYADKVPASVQEANKDKEIELEAELQQLDSAFATLSTMD